MPCACWSRHLRTICSVLSSLNSACELRGFCFYFYFSLVFCQVISQACLCLSTTIWHYLFFTYLILFIPQLTLPSSGSFYPPIPTLPPGSSSLLPLPLGFCLSQYLPLHIIFEFMWMFFPKKQNPWWQRMCMIHFVSPVSNPRSGTEQGVFDEWINWEMMNMSGPV